MKRRVLKEKVQDRLNAITLLECVVACGLIEGDSFAQGLIVLGVVMINTFILLRFGRSE